MCMKCATCGEKIRGKVLGKHGGLLCVDCHQSEQERDKLRGRRELEGLMMETSMAEMDMLEEEGVI